MDNSIVKSLEIVAGLVLLTNAISHAFKVTASLNNIVSEHKEMIFNKTDEVVSLYDGNVSDNLIVPYNEIIGTLIRGIDCEIIIGNEHLYPATFEPLTYNYNMIENVNYRKSYGYGADGTIVCIHFIPERTGK